MKECPNCGHKSYTGGSLCSCTWSERMAAARIKEAMRRRVLAGQGRPVLVDNQRTGDE